ncbi:hypothetical protein HYPSUDRAFT_127375 [Hypholoma sublateritium FD-334 SS-4]|uniref:Uncharacterized protein n=1 Tax=Hypholoma sublateritium (strain FD-334 SS-4) TaxID=945553 RepID=A0A0D2QC15_HYPSF|nr:hypothetical protein HYPSUDRAFT_127375 [Hypholoma sublateritium FD-334 SS-4]
MPSLQSYDILLDLTNDMQTPVSVQLLRDYGRTSNRIIVLHPTESLTLILESGTSYQYAVKLQAKVANVTAKSWRDVTCPISQLFTGSTSDAVSSNVTQSQGGNGIRVDRVWKDNRFNIWNDL